jgi:putative transposase
LPDIPLHIVQRGVNRQSCFLQRRDYRTYLLSLREMSALYAVAVHAYVLMTNHVHLLVTPADEFGASCMMQQLGRQYVSYFNATHARTGPLWEGRFRSSMISSSRYLLACYRYIELNPVRAHIVPMPNQYPWSSYRANALAHHDDTVTPHADVIALGDNAVERCARYRALFATAVDEDDEAIRIAWRKGVALK